MGADKGGKHEGQQHQWQHAVAGCTAGLATVLALQPLDVIKTRLQVQDGAGALPLYRGTFDAVRHIVREEGWRALYSGLTPALIGSGMAWGAYFFTYNRAKQRYQRQATSGGAAQQQGQGQPRLSPVQHLLSAAEAGVVVCFLTNPVWVVKTRLQLQRGGGLGWQKAAAAGAGGGAAAAAGPVCAQYRGFTDALVQIARTEGMAGLYKGLLPSLLLVSHGAIQLAVYEELKALMARSNIPAGLSSAWGALATSFGLAGPGQGPLPVAAGSGGRSGGGSGSSNVGGGRRGGAMQQQRTLSSFEITACGALSKLAASVATYPSQVVRSRLQQRMDCGRTLQYTGVADVLQKTLAREGVRGLYKGLLPNVLRVMPQSALTFLVYESVMHYLRQKGGDGSLAGAAGNGGRGVAAAAVPPAAATGQGARP